MVLDDPGICLADEDTAHPVKATKQFGQYLVQWKFLWSWQACKGQCILILWIHFTGKLSSHLYRPFLHSLSFQPSRQVSWFFQAFFQHSTFKSRCLTKFQYWCSELILFLLTAVYLAEPYSFFEAMFLPSLSSLIALASLLYSLQ